MLIQAFPSGPLDTNAYLIVCKETKIAAIIDPSPDSSAILIPYIQRNHLVVDKILLTHSHWDHIGDLAKIKKEFPVPIYVHAEDRANVVKPGSDRIPCWILVEGVEPDLLLNEGDLITVGNLDLRVIYTPGHSPGSVCFYCEKKGVLMSGDTLFKGSIGILSLPTGQPERMWPSLAKLAKLPGETKVYPGHGGSTTISEERWLPQAEKIFG